MLSPSERHDKLVRATDLDALSCRLSANRKSYFDPPDPYIEILVRGYNDYLKYCAGYSVLSANRHLKATSESKKLPLINRGTYLRTISIDLIIDKFIDEFSNCQIISLGSGSDTRAFRMIQKKSLTYHEIDYEESVKIKKLAILDNAGLKRIIEYPQISENLPTSTEEFKNFDPEIHTSNYHLHSFDLRNFKNDSSITDFPSLAKHIDVRKPTLILSECVLCYLSPQENKNVIDCLKREFESHSSLASFVIYEPMSLNDSFGKTMNDNLTSRGINLMTFNEYPTLESRCRLFEDLKFNKIRLTNIREIGEVHEEKTWLEQKEVMRLNKLELIDEVEEIKLLFEHYCLCYAETSIHETFNGIDSWKWLIK